MLWPNEESAANSDRWLIDSHDRLTLLRPRVLVLNLVHGLAEADARRKVDAICAAVREASRWHGYADPRAPAFLDYDVRGLVDLTEPAGRYDHNSARWPRATDGVHLDYGRLYELELLDGLRLGELCERGLVNEVWLLGDHTRRSEPWETVEVKQIYDEQLRPLPGFERHAGNAGEHSAPWIGRSLRIMYVNAFRGVGCALENLGHTLERTFTCGALPSLEAVFREWAMLDLDRRFGLPFDSLYARGHHPVDYPTPTTMRYHAGGWRRRRVENYVVTAGNVHFPPNGRFDYDLDNRAPVMSTIETWRQPDEDPRPWTPTVLDRYRDVAPDCMGRWLVYWCQNMPGLGNAARDDDGGAMKNWWPFLFY